MISRACRTLPGCKTKAAFAVVENLSATRQTCRLVFASRSNHSQKLGTPGSLESSPQQERARREGNGQREKKIVDLDEPTTTGPYALPQATWSLSDLNVATDDEEATETARAILSPQEVAKLCALAHIELVQEGGGGSGSSSSESSDVLDVAAVQRDVGAMLRCMQTMRRERVGERGSGGGGHSTGENRRREGKEGEGGEDGPWGGAVPWAAPMQEDVVSDGGIQEKVLGAAQRTEDGFFTAPRVVEK